MLLLISFLSNFKSKIDSRLIQQKSMWVAPRPENPFCCLPLQSFCSFTFACITKEMPSSSSSGKLKSDNVCVEFSGIIAKGMGLSKKEITRGTRSFWTDEDGAEVRKAVNNRFGFLASQKSSL